ncbi:hypothetical protein chiPu_0002895 [Chiloscyllium punctatum]|uniref:40S ribosomal protein S19 n=1 Tax=Chiloscyllium punctatum TaxID=137246 RepID=A0A401S254_CHIPU|nr:hypothetical protein [Chiloscyllium punctatum]
MTLIGFCSTMLFVFLVVFCSDGVTSRSIRKHRRGNRDVNNHHLPSYLQSVPQCSTMYNQYVVKAEKVVRPLKYLPWIMMGPLKHSGVSSEKEHELGCTRLGKHKELASYDENWFYTHAASTVHHLYLSGGVGVGAMTKIYGGRQRNSVKPRHFSHGSKSVAWKVLQAPEGLKMVEKGSNGGRRLTPQGQRDLDCIAGQVAAASKKY